EQRTPLRQSTTDRRMLRSKLDQQFRRSQFKKPQLQLLRHRPPAILEVVRFNKSADHRPILVALSLLGSHEIGQRHQLVRTAALRAQRHSSLPKLRKGVDAAHLRHNVYSQSINFRSVTAEVNRVTFAQILGFKSWNCDDFS